ncbi:FtsW/RodA/SpoVE family cell cycle protein, partial [Bacillus sp. S34]|nr:FtsW/RodA/SpoVE family cell cycle protein [Bacillus sp. S34]
TFPRARDLGPILVMWGAAMGVLVFQRDLGTALLYFGLFLVMIYVATARLGWVVIGLVLFVGGALVGLDGTVRGRNGSPEYVRRACDRSLRHLGTDVIDLYYLRRADPAVPIDE